MRLDWDTIVVCYALMGVLWAVYVVRCMYALHGDRLDMFWGAMVAALNAVLWPVCLAVCIIWCPVPCRNCRRRK